MLMSLVNHRYLAAKPNEPGPVTVSATGSRPDRKDGVFQVESRRMSSRHPGSVFHAGGAGIGGELQITVVQPVFEAFDAGNPARNGSQAKMFYRLIEIQDDDPLQAPDAVLERQALENAELGHFCVGTVGNVSHLFRDLHRFAISGL